MIRYIFKEDAVLAFPNADKADAQKLGESLAALGALDEGHIHTDKIVEAARKKGSPLHRHFTWNDRKAAELRRADEARAIVRAIHRLDVTTDAPTRAFVSIRQPDGVSYRTIDDVLSSADLQSRYLGQLERELLGLEEKYKQYSDICDLIRNVRDRVAARRTTAGQDSRVNA